MNKIFAKFTNVAAIAAGHPLAFLVAVGSVIVWGVTGPLFGFSETWQLVINTGTTIITFLMVFVIQNAQNRDGAAIQAKLDELIRASQSEDAFIGIERLPQDEVEAFRRRCEAAANHAAARNAAAKHAAAKHAAAKHAAAKHAAAKDAAAGGARRQTSTAMDAGYSKAATRTTGADDAGAKRSAGPKAGARKDAGG